MAAAVESHETPSFLRCWVDRAHGKLEFVLTNMMTSMPPVSRMVIVPMD